MKTTDFNYVLPEAFIARYPLENRSDSRLMVLDQGRLQHFVFSQLPDLLQENDLLVFNNTRVIPARLFAKKVTGGKVEILIERILNNNHADAQVRSNKSLRLPCSVFLDNGVKITILEKAEDFFKLRFEIDGSLKELLNEIGSLPLPGYMQRAEEKLDQQRYQTIYALHEGAVAAPTAGLHFDHALFENLKKKGIKSAFITLHVGAGTFQPVRVEQVEQHKMHDEIFEISAQACALINEVRSSHGRVIAVGTTTARALETAMRGRETLLPCAGKTDIFIYPGFQFRCIDSLITNFHLPRSTLLMLVCALGGYVEVMAAYEAAIAASYRFYSYGDAMWVMRA